MTNKHEKLISSSACQHLCSLLNALIRPFRPIQMQIYEHQPLSYIIISQLFRGGLHSAQYQAMRNFEYGNIYNICSNLAIESLLYCLPLTEITLLLGTNTPGVTAN